jgi:hypothetical protein
METQLLLNQTNRFLEIAVVRHNHRDIEILAGDFGNSPGSINEVPQVTTW